MQPKRGLRVFNRLFVVLIVALLTAAAVAIAIPWGRYRFNHVVLSEASIRGTVAKIGARHDGRIKSIEVEIGQRVKKGDVMLRMEDRHLQAAVERARGELQGAVKNLETEKLSITQARRQLTIEIERADAARRKAAGELEADKSNLAKWKKQQERFETLLEGGTVSASQLDMILGEHDRAVGLVDAGNAVVEAAESSYQRAGNELEGVHVRDSRLGVLESMIDVARANLSAAETDLDDAVIRAPEDGRVLERIVEVGGSAKVGEPMIALWIGRPWIEAWADERDLREIRIGSPVDISIDAAPDDGWTGSVESFGLMTDKQHQTTPVPSTLRSFLRQNAMVPVRISLDADDARLQLGLSVLVGIRKETAPPDTGGSPADATAPPELSSEVLLEGLGKQ